MKSREPEKLEDDQEGGASWGAGRQTETSLEQPEPARRQLVDQPSAELGAQGQRAAPESTQVPTAMGLRAPRAYK